MLSERLEFGARQALAGLLISGVVLAGCSAEDAEEEKLSEAEREAFAVKEETSQAESETARAQAKRAPEEQSVQSPQAKPEDQPTATAQEESEQKMTAAAAEQASARASADTTGERIYKQACSACHKTGVAGAPKLGEAEKWKERAAKGKDVLFEHVKNGFNAMPPKGACAQCSDEELRAGIDYMLNQSL